MAGSCDLEAAETVNTTKTDSGRTDRFTVVSEIGKTSETGGSVSLDPAFYRAQLAALAEEERNERKTHLCCGSCCDLRKACIIVDSIYLFFVGGAVLLSVTGLRMFERVEWKGSQAEYDDDQVQRAGNDTIMYLAASDIQLGIGVFFCVLGILGACRFQKYLVLCTAIWYCIDVVLFGIFMNWVSAVFAGAYAYPHFALFLALRSGTMTRENYKVTEQHCCCGN